MGEVVRMPKHGGDVITTLREVLHKAEEFPKTAVIVATLHEDEEGWTIELSRAGSTRDELALAARMLHVLHKAIDNL